MKILFSILLIIFILLFVLLTVLNLVSKKKFFDREKSSPFECGFDPKTHSRLPFSLQFFLIAIIFIIFDIEIAILLPMIISIKKSNLLTYIYTSFLFIFVLILGLIHEWSQGSLNWSI